MGADAIYWLMPPDTLGTKISYHSLSRFTILQLSAATFLIPAGAAAGMSLPVSSGIYLMNALVSLWVHRGWRVNINDTFDYLDSLSTVLWVLINTYHWLNGLVKICARWGGTPDEKSFATVSSTWHARPWA